MFVPQGTSSCFVFTDIGVVEEMAGPDIGEGFDTYIKGKCNSKGYEVETVGTEILNISVGETMPKWDSYVKIPY